MKDGNIKIGDIVRVREDYISLSGYSHWCTEFIGRLGIVDYVDGWVGVKEYDYTMPPACLYVVSFKTYYEKCNDNIL